MVLQEHAAFQWLLTLGMYRGRYYPSYSALIELGFDFGAQTDYDPDYRCRACADTSVYDTFSRNDGEFVITRCGTCGFRSLDEGELDPW